MSTIRSAYYNHFVSNASARISAAEDEHSARRFLAVISPSSLPGQGKRTMRKTAIQIVKNGCDMKFTGATRHNQFDD